MKVFTKSQTKFILNNFHHLIGKPLDNELNITQIFAYPINKDELSTLQQGKAALELVESASQSSQFYVKVYSTDLITKLNIPGVIRESIEAYLSSDEMEEVLLN